VNAQRVPLCVGVTGTLTPANARHERALGALKRVAFDAGALPFRDELVKWLADEHAAGRRVVLVADGDPMVDQQVAAHLGLFDEVARADGNGSAADRKRRALVERFGEGGFDYAGSDAADLPVWAAARGAIVVGNSKLADRVGRTTHLLRTFAAPQVSLRTWVKAIRLHQWVKNALVFLPALLAHHFTDPAVLLPAMLAFLAFGCLASSVYVTNDLFDLAADRQHPRKRRRPFAAGVLSVRAGVNASLALLVCAVLLTAMVGWGFGLVLAAYYTLRIIAGSAATHIELSFWLLAFSVFVFLSLGFVKRYAELYDSRKAGKLGSHGRGYGADDLALIMNLGTASGYCAVVVIALYINSAESVALYHHHKTMWLICPLMLFWISRVWMLTTRGHMHDDPVVFALRDRVSLLVLGALGLIVLLSI